MGGLIAPFRFLLIPAFLARRPPRKLKGNQGGLALARSAPRRRTPIRLRPPSTLPRFLLFCNATNTNTIPC